MKKTSTFPSAISVSFKMLNCPFKAVLLGDIVKEFRLQCCNNLITFHCFLEVLQHDLHPWLSFHFVRWIHAQTLNHISSEQSVSGGAVQFKRSGFVLNNFLLLFPSLSLLLTPPLSRCLTLRPATPPLRSGSRSVR